MKRLALLLPLLVLACGDSPAELEPEPEPDPDPVIVELLVAEPDTGFWLGEGLDLSTLVTGAVTEDGDTIPPPELTWTASAGFELGDDSVRASREARGILAASVPDPATSIAADLATAKTTSAEIQMATVTDLSLEGPWSSRQVCYDSPVAMRDAEDPPIGLDSVRVIRSGGVAEYSETDWADVHRITVSSMNEEIVRWWKDGVADTVSGITGEVVLQDTLAVAFGTSIGADDWMTQISDDPVVYRLAPPGTCNGSDFQGGGTAFELIGS